MPKLEATVNTLELKTNKISDTVPRSEWTDEQYPSAKTLYNTYNKLLDLMHPVGSILITATNENPSEILGGTWQIHGRDFSVSPTTMISETAWTSQSCELLRDSRIFRLGQTIHLRLHLKTLISLYTNNIIGTLNPETLGFSIENSGWNIYNEAALTLDGGGIINYSINQNYGTKTLQFVSNNVLNLLNSAAARTIAPETEFYINASLPIGDNGVKLVDYCNKFYWKRIA